MLSRWYVVIVLIGVPLVFLGLGACSFGLNLPDFSEPTKVRYKIFFSSIQRFMPGFMSHHIKL